MKEKFQQGSKKLEEPRSLSASRVTASEADRSPEIKRKKTSDLQSSGNVQGENEKPNLHDAANHVQRFMYTRALFARMEEKSRPAVEPIQLTRPRKLSNSAAGPLSPALSPEHTKTAPPKDNKWPAADNVDKDNLPQDLGKSGGKSRFEQKSTYSAFSNMAGGLLWKRRQYESKANPDYAKKDDVIGKQNGDTVNLLHRGYDHSGTTRGMGSRKIQSDENLLSNSSSQEVNEPLTQRTRSDSLESANTPQHSYYDSQRAVTLPRNYKPSESVVMRPKRFDLEARKDSAKRLSKEEIQAAINRADSYLSHKSDSSSDFQSKRRSWELREQMSDVSEGNLYGWTKSKNQRLSRSTDCLENRNSESSSKNYKDSKESVDHLPQENPSTVGEKVHSVSSPSRQIPGSKPPIPSKPIIALNTGSVGEPSVVNSAPARRQSPVPKRTAPPPPNRTPPSLSKTIPSPSKTLPSPVSPSSDFVSNFDDQGKTESVKTTPNNENLEKTVVSETKLDLQSVNSQDTTPRAMDMERPYQNVTSSKSGLHEPTSHYHSEKDQRTASIPKSIEGEIVPKETVVNQSAYSPSSVIANKGVDSDSDLYEPVIPKCHLPPPPPYPNPPPPPYESHVSPSSNYSTSLPSTADQPPSSHHYENVKSSTYVNDENYQEVRNGEVTPPTQKRLTDGVTEESDKFVKTG
jgi:hypothetical protein